MIIKELNINQKIKIIEFLATEYIDHQKIFNYVLKTNIDELLDSNTSKYC